MTTAPRLTDRLSLLADARFRAWMDARASRGQQTVKAPTVRAVVWALVQHSNSGGHAFPSIETLAEESDTSPATVKRVVSMLRQDGIVRVRARNRGAGAGRKRGEDVVSASNAYTIVWDRFAELRDGGALTVQNTAQSEPCSGDEQGSVGAVNTAQKSEEQGSEERRTGLRLSPKPVVNQKENQPPLPPAVRGEHTGGGSANAQHDDTTAVDRPITDDADRIRAAYPPTSSDLRLADMDAAIAAIRRERALPDGASVDEILAAASDCRRRVASGGLRQPLWLRNWLDNRGYWDHVVAARRTRRRADEPAPPSPAELAEQERERIETARREHIDAPLDALDDEQLEALRRATLAACSPMTREILGGDAADPRRHRNLRVYMASHLAEHGLPTLEREAVPACA